MVYPTQKLKKILHLFILFFCLSFLFFPATAQALEHKDKNASQRVFVGFYLNKIVNLDLKLNTYWFDFYVWFRWKGEIDPTESYEIMNGHEKWGETNVSETDAPRVLPGGWNYREFHIETQLYNPFHFAAYPLDQQILRLSIEDKSYNNTELRYIPDHINTKYDPEVFLPGWQVNKQNIEAGLHRYTTNFGQVEKGDETFSRINYDIYISRSPQLLHLFKLFLPVSIILVMVLVIFFIPISFFEARVEISITGLLSLIALQMVLNETLPPVGYLTLTDRIYNFSYFVVMCALIETVGVYFTFKRDERMSRRIDHFAALLMIALTPIIFGLFFTVFKG